MEIRKVKGLYFSGTGTTEKIVARVTAELARRLGAERTLYDFTTRRRGSWTSFFQRTPWPWWACQCTPGGCPTCWRPISRKRCAAKGTAWPSPSRFTGNRNFDDGLIELRDILEADGLRTAAAAAFIGEHSFSRTLAAGRPDERDLESADAFARAAAEKIAALAALPDAPVHVRGETPLRPYYTPRDRQGNPVNILKVKPKTDPEKCVQCGLCARLCPMGSIDPADPSAVKGICIKCCACVKKCPAGAKYYDDERYLYHQHELEEGFARRAEPELFL